MKVKFYDLEKIDVKDGILKGTVELKGGQKGFVKLTKGKLYIRVEDDKLKKILTQPYPVTLRGKDRSGSLYHKTVDCYPGTREHLKAIAWGCWQFGYLAEVTE